MRIPVYLSEQDLYNLLVSIEVTMDDTGDPLLSEYQTLYLILKEKRRVLHEKIQDSSLS